METDTTIETTEGLSTPSESGVDDRRLVVPWVVRTTRLSVMQEGEPLYGERCSHVSIVDEAAGEFLEIEQQSGRLDCEPQKITVEPDEWPHLRDAIEELMVEICRHNAELSGDRNQKKPTTK